MSTTQAPGNWVPVVIRAMNSLAAAEGQTDELGFILDYMDDVAPNRPEIIAARVRVLLMKKRYSEARATLADCERAHPTNSVIKAMTAVCFYIQGDPLWESYAQEAATLPPNVVTTALLESLAKSSNRPLRTSAATTQAAAYDPQMYFGIAC